MSRLMQVKKLRDVEAFAEHVASLGVDLPIATTVDPTGVLASPTTFTDGSAGVFALANRFAVLPMEGWDGTTDGRPTDLVRRRWQRFADSGCSLVWGEATAVVAEGRANPNQLVLDDETAPDFADLRSLMATDQVVGLQLTHSGRYARPTAAGPAPRTLYAHPVLDDRVGAGEATHFSDDELDDLVATFIHAAELAAQAGFDFVDIKACHGYLGHEFLSAYDRPGRYGGDLAGRTTFLRTVVEGIRASVPQLAVAFRLSIFDLMPFAPGAGHVGVPDGPTPYRHAFGGDGTGLGYDLRETHELLDIVEGLGIGLVSATAGSPYYCPHTQRPAYFPPSDGYQPPEDPLVGVARLLAATKELTEAHPNITMVGSGYSYLQQWLPHVAEAVVGGGTDLVGLGRMILSYPRLAADVLAGQELDSRLICRTFSDCTTAPRAGLVSGCFPLDDFYKQHPDRAQLAAVKAEIRTRLRGASS